MKLQFKIINLCVFILILSMTACIIPKDARVLKRETAEWRESKMVFQAYTDSPFSSTIISLRENGKYEYITTGIIRSFEAGEWTMHNDTLILTNIDQKGNLDQKMKYYYSRDSPRLTILGKDDLFGFRILFSDI